MFTHHFRVDNGCRTLYTGLMTNTTKAFIYISDLNDSSAYLVKVDTSQTSTLQALQALVDGLVAVVSTDWGDVWVNDEGLFRNDFRVNYVASTLGGQHLVGPAVITSSDAEGETICAGLNTVAYLATIGMGIDRKDGEGWTVEALVAKRVIDSVMA